MTFFLGRWRELAIVGLFVALMVSANVIQHRDDTIAGLNRDMTVLKTTVETDNKWLKSQSELMTSVIESQNGAIQRVITALDTAAADITAKVDGTRNENAKKVEQLRTMIRDLPVATNCTIMMENMIKSGQAVPW